MSTINELSSNMLVSGPKLRSTSINPIGPYVNIIKKLDTESVQLQPEKRHKPFVIERFHLPDAVKDEIQSLKPNWGFGQFSEVVFYRTYSRVKSDGTMESWNDVVIRVVEGTFSIRKDWYIKTGIKWDEDFWTVYARGFALSMFAMNWLPPGRGLWTMGTDFIYERGSMALNNCGAIEVTDAIGECAHWLADVLMMGVGAGFAPIRNDEFEIHWPEGEYDFVIPDSREGWCDSIQAAIDCYLTPNCKKPNFDYRLVRPAGLAIKGFGGISSGPEPLIKLHKRIDTFFEMYDTLDWYDTVLLKADIMNAIGACVVAGNVRRSAEICLGLIDDQVFLDLKNYDKYPHRAEFGWLSNNSACLDENEDYEHLGEIAKRVIKNAEPGVYNRRNVKYGRLGKHDENLKKDPAKFLNPCALGSDLILTQTGLKRFVDLQIGEEIWSSSGWTKVLNKWSNGIKPVYKYETTAGYICLTEDHKVMTDGMKCNVGLTYALDVLRGPKYEKTDLDPQDIMDGLIQGDGTTNGEKIKLIIGVDDQDYFNSEIRHLIYRHLKDNDHYDVRTTQTNICKTYEREIPERFLTGNFKKVCGFLRGLYTANGSIVRTRVTLKASSIHVIRSVQKMLLSVGIISYYTTNKEHDVEFRNGIYTCKESYDLNIYQRKDVIRFSEIIGFIQKYKTLKLRKIVEKPKAKYGNDRNKNTYDIISKKYLGEHEVFDITVDNALHTFWCDGFDISNCGEQPLSDRELCTLVETLPTRCKTVQEWYKACEYATVYASTVTLLPTHREDTNAIMLKNRRIGCGIVDYSGWKYSIGLNQVIKHLRKGYDIVRQTNAWVQDEAGVPHSIRVTTAKPGGSVPKLAGRTAGIGHPNFHYTLRRMRIAIDSPITPLLIEANVPYEKDVVSDNTYVFEFPILQGPAKPANQVSVWEQINNVVTVQREWSDNAVSNTITFVPEFELAFSQPWKNVTGKDFKQFEGKEYRTETVGDYINIYVRNPHHEEGDLESALAANIAHVKSLSLLPASNRGVYLQMPEEGISVDEYEKRLSVIKPIDWSKLRYAVAEPEKYCTGEACELPSK